MLFGSQAIENKGRVYRACLSGILVAVLAFPPNAFADAISWNGGTGNYSDPTNWTCTPSCNAFDNPTYTAVINSGLGDSVLLDTPSVITSLGLGGSGSSAQSVLQASGPSLTLGDHDTYSGTVLHVSNGGVLNIDSGSVVTLELSPGSTASVSRGGAINIGDGGSLTVHNDQAGYSTLTNYGSVNVNSGGALTLSDGGSSSTFDIAGRGTLTLAGGQIVGTSGLEALENDSTIKGNGTIASSLGSFNNYGTVQASGGLLKVDAAISDLNAGQLDNGTYKVADGSTLQLSSLGSGPLTTIGSSASLSVSGTGLVTGDGTTNALTGLQNVSGAFTLGSGASLAIDPSAGSFGAYNGGSVKVFGGSTLDTSNVTFADGVDLGSNGGNYTIGTGSTLKYSGADITSVNGNGSLTLYGNGQLLNTSATANPGGLGATLNYVNGSLTLDGGANLTVTSGSFTAGGSLSVTGGSNLDLSTNGTVFGNEVGGVLQQGAIKIGNTSSLTYAGNDIGDISIDASLTLEGSGKLVNTTGQNADPLSATLAQVDGSLSLTHGASLTLGGQQETFTVNGSVDLESGAKLNLAAANFTNEQGGVLTGGTFSVGYGSTLTYAGNDITEIGNGATLTLGGTGQVINTNGEAAHDAISNSLTTIDAAGGLLVTDRAKLTLTQAVTNYGGNYGEDNSGVAVTNGGKLVATNGFTNASTESSAACGCAGSAQLGFSSGSAFITGGLNNISSSTSSFEYPSSSIYATDHSFISTDSLLNQATLTSSDGPGSSEFSPQATIDLGGRSTLLVSGNATNSAQSTNGSSSSYAYIALDQGSRMKVGGTFTNDGGAGLNYADLALDNGSKATVTGLFSNVGGANVLLDVGYESFPNGGSTLNTNGGFSNVNSTVVLNLNSTLNASYTPPVIVGNPLSSSNLLDGGDVYGFANTSSDDPASASHTALLQLGFTQQETESDGPPENTGSTANITGGLVNAATTSNGGYAKSEVSVDGASTLNADFVANNATAQTASDGGRDYASAKIEVQDGSSMHVTGALTNGSYVLNGSTGHASASVSASNGSSIQVDGGVTNYNSRMSASSGSSLTVGNGFANNADDQNSTHRFGTSTLSLAYGASGSITGGLTNSASTSSNGRANAEVSVKGSSLLHVDSLTNSASNATGDTGFASAKVYVGSGSTLSVDGNVANTYTPSDGGHGYAAIAINDSTMTVGGTFTNTSASLFMTNGSQGTVTGLFTNDANSLVNLDHVQQVVATSFGGLGSGSTLNTNGGFQNYGTVNLNQNSTVNNLGAFTTSGIVNVMNGSTLSVGPLLGTPEGDGPPPVVTAGSLTNTGTITTGGSGFNTINVTGDAFNTAPGVVNIQGYADQLTASGKFTNSGSVTVSGENASVSAATISNLAGGSIEVSGQDASVSADSLDQAGTLKIDAGAQVVVTNTYQQTAGETTVAANSSLQATLVEISGGTLDGGGTIYGNLTVDGGTLNPGDPQSIDIVGNYDQTLLGILDLDFASPDSYDQIFVSNSDADETAGNVTLGGTLELNLEDGFGIGVDLDTVFHIMSWTGQLLDDSDFNTFDDVTFSNGSQLLTFKEVFTGQGLDLDVVAATEVSDAPEPASISMCFGVLLLVGGAAWMRRRRALATR